MAPSHPNFAAACAFMSMVHINVNWALLKKQEKYIDAARITKLTQNCSAISPGNSFILGSEGQRLRSRVTKTLLAWTFALL